MRFDNFNLKAYGPYTERTLELPAQDGGDLHVIYGPNEAGKSSLLRAIRDMLFGIPAKTTDNFIHEYRKLRVGGQVSTPEKTLAFLRKKGNVNTLLATDESALSESEMSAFLGAIDVTYFTQMFGLDTEKLRSGAQALLSGEGSTGEILFSASNGGVSVKETIASLQAESDQFFRPRKAKGVKVYETLDQIKALKKELKDSKLKPAAYAKATRIAQKLQESVSEMRARTGTLEQSLRTLEAQKQAIPIYLRYEESISKLQQYDLPTLAPDFAQNLRQQQLDMVQAEASLSSAQASLASIKSRIDSLPDVLFVDSDISKVEALVQQEDVYRYHMTEHLKFTTDLERVQSELQQILEDLNLSSITDIPPVPSQQEFQKLRATLRGLYELQAKDMASSQEIEMLERNIQGVKQDLQTVGEPQEVARLTDLFSRIESHYLQLSSNQTQEQVREGLQRGCDALFEVLGMKHDCVVEEWSLPAEELATRYSQELQEEARQKEFLNSQLQELEMTLIDKQAKLDDLNLQGTIPTQRDLEEIRNKRTRLMEGVLSEERDVKSLVELQSAINLADHIVDQLRAHSDRTLEVARLQNELRTLTQKKALLQERLHQTVTRLKSLRQEWADLLSSLPIRTVEIEELSEVRLQWRALLEKRKALRDLEITRSHLQETTHKLLKECEKEELPCDIGDFERTYRWMKADQAMKSERQGRREELLRQLYEKEEVLKREVENASSLTIQQQKLEQEWQVVAEAYALPHAMTDSESVQAIFDQRNEAMRVHKASLETLKKIEALRAETQAHEWSREKVLKSYHGVLEDAGLSTQAVEIQWQYLIKLKGEALERQQKLSDLQERYSEQKQACEELLHIYDSKQQLLHESLKLAHVERIEDIEAFLSQLSEQMTLLQDTHNLEETLLSLFPAQGDIESVSRVIRGVEYAEVEREIWGVSEDLERVRRDYDTARDQMNVALEEQRVFEAESQKAADTEQTLASLMADLKVFGSRYLSLQSAIQFLQQQVEEYRQENQGPMIRYTSEYFRELTCQQYKGVVNQLDEQNTPRLYAVDGVTGDLVEVSHLSEGTGDQLYLALRLAALKLHFQSRSPMPLILDDILMTFDEKRTVAVLKVLQEFSQKTQVFIFTHHQHISDLAKLQKAHIINLNS